MSEYLGIPMQFDPTYMPETVQAYQLNDELRLFCSTCALIISRLAPNTRQDLIEDEAFIHAMKCHQRNHHADPIK
jgi:hypothetical protein